MANPIQDWLNKFKKPTKTVSGTAKAGTTTSRTTSGTTASGRAGVGTRTANPTFTPVLTNLQAQKDAMAKKTNQDIINAAYKVAEDLSLKGGPWPLMRAAGWGHLTDKRGDLYKGKAIDEIDKLTVEQKAALKRALSL